MTSAIAKNMCAPRRKYNWDKGRGERSLESENWNCRSMSSEASCPPRASELTAVQVKLIGSLGGDEPTSQKKVKLTKTGTILQMIQKSDPIMEIKHTNGAPDRIDQKVDRVSIPVLNLSVKGKFLKRIETLATNGTRGVEEKRRGDRGDRQGDIIVSKFRH